MICFIEAIYLEKVLNVWDLVSKDCKYRKIFIFLAQKNVFLL